MFVLIWIQTIWHSDSAPDRIFRKSLKKGQQTSNDNKSVKNYTVTQHANS